MNKPAANLLDRVIGWLDPRAGATRSAWRSTLHAISAARTIDAARGGRTRSDWSTTAQSADSAIRLDRDRCRAIVRDLVLNNPYAAAAVTRLSDNVVGNGIRPQCALTADEEGAPPPPKAPPGWRPITKSVADRFCAEAEALWAEFADRCDVTQTGTFYDLQRAIARARMADGEVLVHFPRQQDGGPGDFQVELIDVDRLAALPADAPKGAIVRDGVELDAATGRPVAYYVLPSHPSDIVTIKLKSMRGTRIPRYLPDGRLAATLYFRADRPGQTRGVSDFAPALGVLEDLHRYWEAEIVAARVGACYSAFVTTPGVQTSLLNAGEPSADGTTREEKLAPGMIWYGRPGEDIKFGDPKRPNSQFDSFTKTLLRALGAAIGVPFEVLALDFSDTTYTSSRSSTLEARRGWKSEQARIINGFCKPAWRSLVIWGVATGRLTAPGFAARREDYLASLWVPPPWGWVDPTKEVTAAKESASGLLSTLSDELAAQGRDFGETVDRIAREHDYITRRGLPSPWARPTPQDATQSTATPAPADDAPDPSDVSDSPNDGASNEDE